MELGALGELIGSIGFPIVCCIGLGWFIYRAFEKIISQSTQREEKLYKMIEESHNVNKELTSTNAEFVQVLDSYKDDLDTIKMDISAIKDKFV